MHLYCDSNPTTPKGRLTRSPADPASLEILPVKLPREIEKGRFFDRWSLERLYGLRLTEAVIKASPDLVISANTPLDAQARLQAQCHGLRIPFIFWAQDLIGEATTRILQKKLPLGGSVIGAYYQIKEKTILRKSDRVIGITEDFAPYFKKAGILDSRVFTIPNWSPLAEVVPRSKQNDWAKRFGLDDKFVFLYSGTLGFKHNPSLFLALAEKFRAGPSVRIVVNSQGDAADWLRRESERLGCDNLQVNPFQPYEEMSNVLASADVLLAILEPEAGRYSVPSKVLSYHCAARPILLAVPPENLAARIVLGEKTGCVADPGDAEAFGRIAQDMYDDADGRRDMALRARRYAEEHFNVAKIAGRFESIFRNLLN